MTADPMKVSASTFSPDFFVSIKIYCRSVCLWVCSSINLVIRRCWFDIASRNGFLLLCVCVSVCDSVCLSTERWRFLFCFLLSAPFSVAIRLKNIRYECVRAVSFHINLTSDNDNDIRAECSSSSSHRPAACAHCLSIGYEYAVRQTSALLIRGC